MEAFQVRNKSIELYCFFFFFINLCILQIDTTLICVNNLPGSINVGMNFDTKNTLTGMRLPIYVARHNYIVYNV